jgi:hypothetical protein
LRASATGSVSGSPSKNRDMAIWRTCQLDTNAMLVLKRIFTYCDVPLRSLEKSDGGFDVLVCDCHILLQSSLLVRRQRRYVDCHGCHGWRSYSFVLRSEMEGQEWDVFEVPKADDAVERR